MAALTTTLLLTAAAVTMTTASVAVSMYGEHKTRKAMKNAAHDADVEAKRLAAEQAEAERNAELQAIEETKAKRRAVTQTIFSEQSDQYSLNNGSITLGAV